MLSKQIDMADKLEVHENEKKLREQGSTFLSHTHDDTGGRFAAISSPVVVGENQIPNYPAGPNWCAADQGLEPPFPVDISAQEPTGEKFEVERSLGPSTHSAKAPPNPALPIPPGERAGLGSLSLGDPSAVPSKSSSRGVDVERVGSPSLSSRTYRRA